MSEERKAAMTVSQMDSRYKELQEYRAFFAKQLEYVISRMPAPAIMVDLITGEHQTVNDPKCQELIEKLVSEFNDHIRKMFPEFYQK